MNDTKFLRVVSVHGRDILINRYSITNITNHPEVGRICICYGPSDGDYVETSTYTFDQMEAILNEQEVKPKTQFT